MISARVALLPEQLEALIRLRQTAWDAMPDVSPEPLDQVTLAQYRTVCYVFRILGIEGWEPAPSGGVDDAGASELSQRATETPDGLTREGKQTDATLGPGGRHRRSDNHGYSRWRRRRDLPAGAVDAAAIDGGAEPVTGAG